MVDGWEVGQVGEDVADEDGNECESDADGAEAPLLVDGLEGLEEGEDEGVGEAGEEREPEDNGFREEHVEWSENCQWRVYESASDMDFRT